ncbi:hypothetical protein SASPL_158144 [Salvia splendens]|uniref:5'-AMP-activated protein kinase, regulatory gamma subunit n=1 Tax=Salvia splendens TaxID=180675 RepID=A0A8X8VTR6_SALSN|nr:hypothetical protein SASPL_158144 [Salvia splendens]
MLRPSASLGAALNFLIQAQVSSIPIVDDNDSLLDVYSRRHCSTEMTHFQYTAPPTFKDVLCVYVQILSIKSWRGYPSQVIDSF